MKVSLNWLKDYVVPGISPEGLAHKLTMAGLEVKKTSPVKGDTVFEMEITPNRPDCLSLMGIARETAAILNKTRRFPKTKKRAWPKRKCAIEIKDKQGCSRYIGTLIENISVNKAPEGMIKRLTASGIRPVNNVVDITNFCLMENGQPLHAFDYDKLTGGKIVVRRARRGEKIVTIDDDQRELDPSVLVIADAQRPVAIAGIMGGKDTEVTNRTKNILLESAYFDPVLIRRTSRKLGLSSESSYRFERGVDYNMVESGADRAVDLILENTKGVVTKRSDIVAVKRRTARRQITASKDRMNAHIGAPLTAAQYKNVLKKLDFNVSGGKTGIFKITPPSFRNDVQETVDIIEEVSRITGYDRVPLSFPRIKASQILPGPQRSVRSRVRDLLLAQGFNEIITYTMISCKSLEWSNLADIRGVAVFNPLTQDQEVMRPSMLPSLLSTVLSNINRGQKNIKLFETGKIYTANGEEEVLGIIMMGLRSDNWRSKEEKNGNVDYYDLKGPLEQTLERCGIKKEKIQFKPAPEAYFAVGQGAFICICGRQVGVAGKIEEDVLGNWGIKQKNVFFAQMGLDGIYGRGHAKRKYKPISEFPVISRDISLDVRPGVTAHDIEEAIRKTVHKEDQIVLTDIRLSARYKGVEIPKDHQGLLFSLTYQSRLAKTLRDEEVAHVHEKVCDVLIKDLGVVQR